MIATHIHTIIPHGQLSQSMWGLLRRALYSKNYLDMHNSHVNEHVISKLTTAFGAWFVNRISKLLLFFTLYTTSMQDHQLNVFSSLCVRVQLSTKNWYSCVFYTQ